MNRFFVDNPAPDTACIEGDDFRHLAYSLRLKVGEQVMICNGRGQEAVGTVAHIGSARAVVSLGPWGVSPGEPTHRITLFQCLPKAGKMETILQKGTELGVCAFVPVVSRRCVGQPGQDFDRKLHRYQKVVREAAMQSGRGIVPPVLPLQRLERLALQGFSRVLCAYEGETSTTLRQAILPPTGDTLAIIIGPEGGFEPEEVALLQGQGAVSVSLGRRILRTETAGMAMAAQILFAWEG